MKVTIALPELGENIQAARVIRMLVAPGDVVARDQPIAEVESDKATAEIPATAAGTVREVRAKAGDELRVGDPLLTLETDAGAGERPAPAAALEPRAVPPPPGPAPASSAAAAPRPTPAPAASPPPQATAGEPPRPGEERRLESVPAAPHVRRLARELGLDLLTIPGSGPAGRLSEGDVISCARALIAAASAAPPVSPPGAAERSPPPPSAAAPPLPDFRRFGEVTVEPMDTIRRKTAESVATSWALIPHVTQGALADVTTLEELRAHHAPEAAAAGGKLTLTAILVRLAAAALRAFPQFNASVDMERRQMIYKRSIHIGVAVDTERGLLVPVVRDADQKGLIAIAVELSALAERARQRKLHAEDLEGATFTITNLGGLGTTTFTPIVHWPEVAILGVGRAETQAVHVHGTFVPRLRLPLSLAYDHRAADGADAARFLRFLTEALERPFKILL